MYGNGSEKSFVFYYSFILNAKKSSIVNDLNKHLKPSALLVCT